MKRRIRKPPPRPKPVENAYEQPLTDPLDPQDDDCPEINEEDDGLLKDKAGESPLHHQGVEGREDV